MCQSLLNLSPQERYLVSMALIKAVKNGRVEFVTAILKTSPSFLWTWEADTRTDIYMLAVVYRQNKVFQLLCGFPLKNAILSLKNNGGITYYIWQRL